MKERKLVRWEASQDREKEEVNEMEGELKLWKLRECRRKGKEGELRSWMLRQGRELQD